MVIRDKLSPGIRGFRGTSHVLGLGKSNQTSDYTIMGAINDFCKL